MDFLLIAYVNINDLFNLVIILFIYIYFIIIKLIVKAFNFYNEFY